jgi:hypothetical protein
MPHLILHTEDLVCERSPTTITRDPSPQPRFTSTSIRRNQATPIWEKQKNTAGRNYNQEGSASNCFRTFHSLRAPLTRYKTSHLGKRSLLHMRICPREVQANVCLPHGITTACSYWHHTGRSLFSPANFKLGQAIKLRQSSFHMNGL